MIRRTFTRYERESGAERLSMAGLLLLALGATLYAGVFHGAFARQLPASRWLSAWAISASVYLGARILQLTNDEPAHAPLLARSALAVHSLVLWLHVGFFAEITGERWTPRVRKALLATALALAGVALAAPWVATDRLTTLVDPLGDTYVAPLAGPLSFVYAVATVAAVGWSIRALVRTRQLDRQERIVLVSALATYLALATHGLLSELGFASRAGAVELAPVLVVLGTTLLATNRERGLIAALAGSIAEQDRRLRASEERYRGLVDHAPLGVVVTDRLGNVVTMTERFRKIVGLDERNQPSPTNLLRDAPAHIGAELAQFARALKSRKTTVGEALYTQSSGKRVALKLVVAPQHDDAGRPDGAIILAEDVTERRAVESRLRQALKLEAIGQLAGGIATGVTTPMKSVRENLSALEHGLDELRKHTAPGEASAERLAEIEQLLAESREGVERAIGIVRDMRELANGGSIAREPLDLNALLASVVRMAATQRGGAVAERYGELPAVVANAGQLRQVFLNLVVNALQAAGSSGQVEVETRAEQHGACVRVSDSGAGIAPEHRDRLFVPFFTTKPAGEGTGLGLYLSYQIVQAHGGEIRVDSTPGEGATFSVWLPAERAARAAESQ